MTSCCAHRSPTWSASGTRSCRPAWAGCPARAKAAGPGASKYNDIHRIVTNLGVFDVKGAGDTVRLLSLHPGVTLDEVVENTGFELEVPADVPLTREPTESELMIIRNVLDPKNLRDREVPPVAASDVERAK